MTTFVSLWFAKAMGRDASIVTMCAEAVDLASGPDTTPEVLDQLSRHPLAVVRRAVARNHRTRPSTLARMSRDVDSDVRYWVADNRHTHFFVRARMQGDISQLVSTRAGASLPPA